MPCAPSSRIAAPVRCAVCTARPTSSASDSSRGASADRAVSVYSASARFGEPNPSSSRLACVTPASTSARNRSGCRTSSTRTPRRATLSSYAGPIPRPVVPIALLAALSLSTSLW